MKKIALAAALVALTATPAFAQTSDTDQGVATATVIAPITLTHTAAAALDFGAFTNGAAGTVEVTTGGAGSVTGGVVLVAASTGADSFDVAGEAGRTFTITTGAGTVSDGTTSMSFTTTAAADGTLDTNGAASFSVGGSLAVAGTEPAGTYTGTYDATVAYN